MKNLIRRILKENFDPENFNWVENIRQFTPSEQFLYDLMSELTMVESNHTPGLMLYKNKSGKTLMADNINIDTKNTILYIDLDSIWRKLKVNYKLEEDELINLCKRMLDIVYKRKVLTVVKNLYNAPILWRPGIGMESTDKRKVLVDLS